MKTTTQAPSERRLVGAVAQERPAAAERRLLIKAMAPFEHDRPERLWIADAVAQIEGDVTLLAIAYDHTPGMSERIVRTALTRIANRLACLSELIEAQAAAPAEKTADNG